MKSIVNPFLSILILVLILAPFSHQSTVPVNSHTVTNETAIACIPESHHVSSLNVFVVEWKYAEFAIHITLMVFILIVIIFRGFYHKIHFIAEYLPESLMLIIIGIIFGAVIRYGLYEQFDKTVWRLTPELFFNYLLPPIILESAYSLYNRTFGEYLGSITVYAVIGTILNFLIIGFIMYGLDVAGAMGPPDQGFTLKGYLLFSSLIVAVDPVAVLAIFQDIGVEYSLYYMVFGESLLNDAVTIVLYNIMQNFMDKDDVTATQIVLGVVSFFTIAFGGLVLGCVVGVVSCLITRFENEADFVVILLMGYFSYILGDVVGWSGIIAMIGCGLVQAAYAFHNIRPSSVSVVRQVTKQAAGISEAIIFLFLGIEFFVEDLVWHTGFMLWAIVICLFARIIVTFGLSGIINWVRVDTTKISITEQLILIYGGLRGAVAFSLSSLIEEKMFKVNGKEIRNTIITSTLWIILFTVGLMGMTMKPLVKLLKIKMAGKQELSLFSTLNTRILDHSLSAIESITNQKGRNRVRDYFVHIDDTYIRKILQREPQTHAQKIVKVYEKIALKLHYATVRPDQSSAHLSDLPKNLQKHMTSSLSLSKIPTINSQVDLEPGYSYEIDPSGNVKRKRNPTNEDVSEDEIIEMFRNTRRVSLMNNGRDQETYAKSLNDILKSKGLVIRRRSVKSNSNVVRFQNKGYTNNSYQIDEKNEKDFSSDDDDNNEVGFSLGGQNLKDKSDDDFFVDNEGVEISRH